MEVIITMADLSSRLNVLTGNTKVTNLKNTNNNFSEIWSKWSTKLDVAPDGTNNLILENKINSVYLPDYLLGQLLYGGTVNSSSVATLTSSFKSRYGVVENTITLSSDNYALYEGSYFIADNSCTEATVAGITSVNTGDWIISNGTSWTKIDNTDAVRTVNGQTGNVVTYKGAYADETAYYTGDQVLGTDGVLYTVVQNHTSSTSIPITNTAYYTPAISAALTSKLNAIEAGAQVNVIEQVQVNSSVLPVQGKAVNIPLANGATAGVVTGNNDGTAHTGSQWLTAYIDNGAIVYRDTTYTQFNTSTPGLVPAAGSAGANYFLAADGTFKQVTIPNVPEYTLGTVTNASQGQVQLSKDLEAAGTINFVGAGIAEVASNDSGTVTITVDPADIPSSVTISDVQVTSGASGWTTITVDGEQYAAYPLTAGQKVVKVFQSVSVTIGDGTAGNQLVELDAPVVSTGTIDYVLVESAMAMTVRVISFE